MAGKTSVVTPKRFASGFTYPDYIAQIKVNKDRFEKYYTTAELSADDIKFFRKAAQMPDGIGKMLVVGEDWCPDVFRGMPVMARLAEAAGIEMRIFPRDQHLDIMNEFLNQGKFMSLPVIVFYTKELQHIGHWIERPAIANQERTKIEETAKKESPNVSEPELRTIVRDRTQARYPAWQKGTVAEIRQMLTEKLGL